MQDRIIAIIPARYGSKGLARKNIRLFAGKPLIHWTIEAARHAKGIERVIVSTDSQEIAAIAEQSGAEVPFLRPAQLASDDACIDEAVLDCLARLYAQENAEYTHILLLQPTSPLRNAQHINQAIARYKQMRQSPEDTLLSVVELPEKMAWLMQANQAGYVDFCMAQARQANQRQALPQVYLPNGAIYLAPVDVVRQHGFYAPQALYFPMSQKVSLDIDSLDEFKQAEILFATQDE